MKSSAVVGRNGTTTARFAVADNLFSKKVMFTFYENPSDFSPALRLEMTKGEPLLPPKQFPKEINNHGQNTF